MKAWACICTIVIVLTFTGCAVHMNHDSNKEASQAKIQLSEPKTKTERTTDFSEPVKVSELDYDSLQSQMTDEEWEGFQQYFPVLRENTAFHYTSFEDREALNRNGEPIKEGEYVLFARYTSAEIMDLAHFVKGFADNDIAEMMIEVSNLFRQMVSISVPAVSAATLGCIFDLITEAGWKKFCLRKIGVTIM